jgi:hypothetical protein
MISQIVTILAVLFALFVVGFFLFPRWGTRWGSISEERALRMPGDAYFEGGPPARVAMTRAVSIRARPETVWPWLAQLGRGAGWYSIDWLDNGGKISARHIISWVPELRLGDAAPVGYLRHIELGRALVWWVKDLRFLGARSRLVVDMRLTPEGEGSRLVIRISADAAGPAARIALLVFQFLDSVMARRQLLGIRERVERYGARSANPDDPETGATDQYQLYEVIYASGERAGVPGKEHAERWRQTAIEDGLIAVPPSREGPGQD